MNLRVLRVKSYKNNSLQTAMGILGRLSVWCRYNIISETTCTEQILLKVGMNVPKDALHNKCFEFYTTSKVAMTLSSCYSRNDRGCLASFF